jgi:hypothetical protein
MYLEGKLPLMVASTCPAFVSKGVGVTLNKSALKAPILLHEESAATAATRAADIHNLCCIINSLLFIGGKNSKKN